MPPAAAEAAPARGVLRNLATHFLIAAATWSQEAPEAAPLPDRAAVAARLAASHCVRCHSGERPKGDLVLEGFAWHAGSAERAGVLRKIRERVAREEMPPAEARQPDAAERAEMVSALDALIAAAPAPPPSGHRSLRRLSRVEYENTIRDLLGVEAGAVEDFPAEDLAYGFDNVADALSTSPVFFERALAAAERIAAEAILAEDPANPASRRFEAEELESTPANKASGAFRVFTSNGSVFAPIAVPRTGEYLLRARAWGDHAGNELPQLVFEIDGAPAGKTYVEARRAAPEEVEVRARIAGGRHQLAAAFANDFYDPKNEDASRRDRNLALDWIEIRGPVDARPLPYGHRWILGSEPAEPAAARARIVASRMASRAWRRPARDAEVERLSTLILAALDEGRSFEDGVRLALQAVLVSPNFLFRLELDEVPAGSGRSRPLDGFEIASRLSYALWSSLPDERLTSLAAAGGLLDHRVLEAETERMLRDARASALAENFAAQWLELRGLETITPDPALFPEFDDALRASLRRETELLVECVIRERRPISDLLEADFSFIDERLARFYQLPGVHGPGFRRVPIRDPQRHGLLGHASIAALTSNPTRTSPVKRGKWVLENLLDAPPPPPPPDAGTLDERQSVVAAASIRERLARHRRDPSCSSCHARMDALGFALENFDAIGRWRTRDGAFEVDAAAELPDGRALAGPAGLRRLVATDPALRRSVLKKLFVYSLGRPIGAAELPAAEAAAAALDERATFADVVRALVRLDAFRMRLTAR